MKHTHSCSPEVIRVSVESRDDLTQDNTIREHISILIVGSSTQYLWRHPVGVANNGLLSTQVPRELKVKSFT